MRILEWICVVIALLATGAGAIVLRGMLRVALSGKQVARFFEYSLIAGVAGILPLTRHLSMLQWICILSVYCSGAAVLAWRKFHLAGQWLPVFAFFVVAVLYLNVVTVSMQLFNGSSPIAIASTTSGSRFEILQFFLASVFALLGVLVLRVHHAGRAHSF